MLYLSQRSLDIFLALLFPFFPKSLAFTESIQRYLRSAAFHGLLITHLNHVLLCHEFPSALSFIMAQEETLNHRFVFLMTSLPSFYSVLLETSFPRTDNEQSNFETLGGFHISTYFQNFQKRTINGTLTVGRIAIFSL